MHFEQMLFWEDASPLGNVNSVSLQVILPEGILTNSVVYSEDFKKQIPVDITDTTTQDLGEQEFGI